MEQRCSEFLPQLDGQLDGELQPSAEAAVADHLAACSACRQEIDSRRALKLALARLVLPDCPPIRMAEGSPRWRVAAAILFVASVLLSLPAAVPDVVALTSQLHTDYLEGRLTGLTPRDLGLQISIPGASYVGQCACPPELGASSPFIVYRRGDTPISLLVLEADPGPMPASARRISEGREYYFFRSNRNNAIVCRTGKLCHIWISRMDEEDLAQTLLATREGRSLLEGERLTLEGIT
jgi:hypothetical protein